MKPGPNRSAALAGVLLVALALLAGCAGNGGPRERQAGRLQLFLDAAGPPVDSFQFWQLQRWEALGPEHVAVWTRVREVWLIRVRQPCFGLDFARVIALTSTVNRVSQRFDTVNFEDQRCQIAEIRPVDADVIRGGQPDAG